MSLIRNLDELTSIVCKSRNKKLRKQYAIHLEYFNQILHEYLALKSILSITNEQPSNTNWDTTWRSK